MLCQQNIEMMQLYFSDQVREVVQDTLHGWKWRMVGSRRNGVEETKKELEDIANILIDK